MPAPNSNSDNRNGQSLGLSPYLDGVPTEKSDEELRTLLLQLQSFLEWTPADAERIPRLHALVAPHFQDLVSDFYSEILRHTPTRQVLKDEQQVIRLQQTLLGWLNQLFTGPYDLNYVKARWQVGRRHVAIGLDQTYATAALGRLRTKLTMVLVSTIQDDVPLLNAATGSLHKLLDLESAIINSAYQLSFARMIEQAAQQQMQQSERLAAIGQMVTGLAHESRNALQRSHACLETLAMEIEDRPDAIRLVNRVQTALDHLHTLYEEVRNYAAPIKLDWQAVSLPKLVIRCWHQLEHKWKKPGVKLRFDVEPEVAADITLDPNRIEQVLTNLFQNAIDACGENGEVRCTLTRGQQPHIAGSVQDGSVQAASLHSLSGVQGENPVSPLNDSRPGTDSGPRPEIKLGSVGDTIWIEISDSGPGISVSPPNKIFEPFFTTKTKGTGLGLAISRRAIQAHGGQLELVEGSKATFRISLPSSPPGR